MTSMEKRPANIIVTIADYRRKMYSTMVCHSLTLLEWLLRCVVFGMGAICCQIFNVSATKLLRSPRLDSVDYAYNSYYSCHRVDGNDFSESRIPHYPEIY